jgi:hypothetical protein
MQLYRVAKSSPREARVVLPCATEDRRRGDLRQTGWSMNQERASL